MKHRGRIVLGALLVLAGLCHGPVRADDAGAAAPRLAVEGADFSFGKIPDDHAVEHVFTVKNTGAKPLVVTRVQTSCGCTAAMMESSVIEPGGNGKLRVSFNPHNQKGTVSRTVSIYSNDPATPVMQLRVSADVGVPGEPAAAAAVAAPVAHPREAQLLFTGACVKCHAPRSSSLTGEKLYAAVCAACHGAQRQGAKQGKDVLGPPLTIGVMTVKSPAGIRQVVAAGTGHPFMPGFGKEYGGPLTDRQIDSLVDLVSTLPGKKN